MSTIFKQKTDPKRKLSISKDIGHVKDVTGSCPAYYAHEKEKRKRLNDSLKRSPSAFTS